MPYQATQLKGLKAKILSVTNVAPGQKPTVTFQITENDGTIVAPAPFTSNLNILMGGSTADYAINPFRERADAAAFDGTTATYTFTHAIPPDATGTWTFSIEARRTITLDPHPDDATTFTEARLQSHLRRVRGRQRRGGAPRRSSISPTATSATTSSRSTAASARTRRNA